MTFSSEAHCKHSFVERIYNLEHKRKTDYNINTPNLFCFNFTIIFWPELLIILKDAKEKLILSLKREIKTLKKENSYFKSQVSKLDFIIS